MRHIPTLAAFCVLALGAGRAWAAEPPPPTAPAPSPTAPTAEEKHRVVEMAPPTAAPVAPGYSYPSGPPCAPPCPPPCPDCFQKRDACGCRVDSCGNRWGCWDVTVEGAFAWFGSPDGILGEPIFVSGNQIDWNGTDYSTAFGGRGTIAYHTDCYSRLELRGTYWGNPDGSDSQSGFFAATPGDDGLGDISRPVDTHLKSEAELWGIELNFWHELDCSGRWRFDAGFGARYLSFNEDARADFTTTGPGPFPVDNGYVKSSVTNDFLGAQIMAAAHYDFSECLEGYASLKAMFGDVQRDVHVSDLDIFAGGTHSSKADDDEFVFGLDFELGVVWRLSRCIGIVASYEMLFLDNVQRAEDSFDFSLSNSGSVQAKQNPDQLVVHTVFVGVTFNF